ncbi:hypothetical protein IBA8402_18440 [Pseudomonas syringae]
MIGKKSPEKPREFVDNYLARNYTNPLVESEIKGVKFDLLKCLDLYHSKELEAQTKKSRNKPYTYRRARLQKTLNTKWS